MAVYLAGRKVRKVLDDFNRQKRRFVREDRSIYIRVGAMAPCRDQVRGLERFRHCGRRGHEGNWHGDGRRSFGQVFLVFVPTARDVATIGAPNVGAVYPKSTVILLPKGWG